MKKNNILAAFAALAAAMFAPAVGAQPINDATAAGLVPSCAARTWAQRGYQGDAALTSRNFRDAFSRAAGACVGVDYRVAARLLCSRDRVVGSLCLPNSADELPPAPVTVPSVPLSVVAPSPSPAPAPQPTTVVVQQRQQDSSSATTTVVTAPPPAPPPAPPAPPPPAPADPPLCTTPR